MHFDKKFIKRNILILIFMTIALMIVVFLLVMVFIKHGSMERYDTQKINLVKKINKIFKQKYAPVEQNITRIKGDIDGYKKELSKLQGQFGKPYTPALKSFARELDIPLKEFKTKFGDFWKKQQGRTTRDLIFRRYKVRQFNEDFPKHKSEWSDAMLAFMKEAQKVTLEEVNASNVDGIFLAAMDKGRRFSDSPQRCQTFMRRMRFKMIDYFADKNVDYATTDFSFKHDQLPALGDIEAIAKSWEIVSDLTKRIAAAKVDPKKDKLELISFSKRGLDGVKEGNYILYRFAFTVNGDLATIRRVVKNLYDAYKENRVYAVRDIKMNRLVDEVEDILVESERIKQNLEYDNGDKETGDKKDLSTGKKRGLFARLRNKIAAKKDSKSLATKTVKKEDKKILGPKDPGYAKAIIGRSNICHAKFEVDYIVFVE